MLESTCANVEEAMMRLQDPVAQSLARLVEAQIKEEDHAKQVKKLQEKLVTAHRKHMSLTEDMLAIEENRRAMQTERRRVESLREKGEKDKGSENQRRENETLLQELDKVKEMLKEQSEEQSEKNHQTEMLLQENEQLLQEHYQVKEALRERSEKDILNQVVLNQNETLLQELEKAKNEYKKLLQDNKSIENALSMSSKDNSRLNQLLEERDVEIAGLLRQLATQDEQREEVHRRIAQSEREAARSVHEVALREQFLEMSLNRSMQEATMMQDIQVCEFAFILMFTLVDYVSKVYLSALGKGHAEPRPPDMFSSCFCFCCRGTLKCGVISWSRSCSCLLNGKCRKRVFSKVKKRLSKGAWSKKGGSDLFLLAFVL